MSNLVRRSLYMTAEPLGCATHSSMLGSCAVLERARLNRACVIVMALASENCRHSSSYNICLFI